MSKSFDIEPTRIENDLITILEYLERERDRNLMSGKDRETESILSKEEHEMGIEFLKSEDLFQQIVEDMDILGYVGEDLNKQLLYIAATSRKLPDPISVLIVSESSSGKSMLIDTVAKLIPPEDVIQATSLSDQALNYIEDLKHKFMTLGETVHNETIEHQVREMLSAQELSRLVTTKEQQTGKMVTQLVKTPAIVSMAMSGTQYDMNPENTSRCFVINTDESKEQTKRIHEVQRSKYSLKRYYEKSGLVPGIIKRHHAAQKLLHPVTIVNPFAEYLSFPDSLMRTRRDHDRFIDLIACVCFLRQYQKVRKIDTSISDRPIEFIECDLKDYEIAYSIMVNGVLRSTMLDMPNGSITLYEEIRKMARTMAKERSIKAADVTFIQRDVREITGLGTEFIKKHLRNLVEYEYIQVTSGKNRGTRRSYRLRSDDPLERVDLSMIPSPEEIKKIFKQ